MPAEIEFCFDFRSPYSYLAHEALPAVARRHGSMIRYAPFDLIELMRIVGNRPTTLECRNKGAYAMNDIGRWAKAYDVPFAPNPHWQRIDFSRLGRGVLVAVDAGRGAAYVTAIFRGVWSEALDLGDPSQLVGTLAKASFDGAELLRRADSPEYVARLAEAAPAAARRGAFGSPTMFVGEEMFFGNDRLEFLADALRTAA